MKEPEDQFRGVFIPVAVYNLFPDQINAEELLLLTKIDALHDPHYGGCYASNKFLARWWKKSPDWVSETVGKLLRLKLLKKIKNNRSLRILRTTFAPIGESSDPHRRIIRPPSENHPTPTQTKERKDTSSPLGEPCSLLPEVDFARPFSPEVITYARFTQRREFHILSRNGKIQYAKGGGAGGWTRTTLQLWERRFKELESRVGSKKAGKVLRWYLENYDDEWIPGPCRTMPSFCDKYDKIERAMKRSAKNLEEYAPTPDIDEAEEDTAKMKRQMLDWEKKKRK